MNFKPIVQWQRLFWILPLAAFAVSYVSQLNYDAWRRYGAPAIHTTYNQYIEPQPLSSSVAKASSFGATEFMADIYWLELIQYYGGGDPSGKYRKLAELYNTVTDLSPKFQMVYQTGLLTLPGEGFPDEAITLGQKGIKNLPDSWEMPYYTGLVYHIYKKDYAKAAGYFQLASTLPNAPANTKYLAAIYYSQADQRQTAYVMFKNIYDGTTDTFIKERAQKYLNHLEGIFFLEDGVANFSKKYRRAPKSLDELVNTKIIEAIPVSPLGLRYTYDAVTGKIGEAKP